MSHPAWFCLLHLCTLFAASCIRHVLGSVFPAAGKPPATDLLMDCPSPYRMQEKEVVVKRDHGGNWAAFTLYDLVLSFLRRYGALKLKKQAVSVREGTITDRWRVERRQQDNRIFNKNMRDNRLMVEDMLTGEAACCGTTPSCDCPDLQHARQGMGTPGPPILTPSSCVEVDTASLLCVLHRYHHCCTLAIAAQFVTHGCMLHHRVCACPQLHLHSPPQQLHHSGTCWPDV